MRVELSAEAARQFNELPAPIYAKARRQFAHLAQNIRHPSLHAKKYKGLKDTWQARIDRSWRFYFHIIEPHYLVISIIEHP